MQRNFGRGPIQPTQDVAQICLNGHLINRQVQANPQKNEKFCSRCGAETITACKDCNNHLKGYIKGQVNFLYIPNFCPNCGKPYPWTETNLKVAEEMVEETDLSPKEQEELKKTLPDLMQDNPRTELSAIRFKKLLEKCKTLAAPIRKFVVDIASETAKKLIQDGM